LIGNEVLDAMPVKRLRFREGEWRELGVGAEDGHLREVELTDLPSDLDGLPDRAAEGFTIERCLKFDSWFAEIAAAFDDLHACIIDYGLETGAEFFDPGRREGTLRAYQDHQLVDDPLVEPGSVDLTTHVDFEMATSAAKQAGLSQIALTDQHRFLVAAARDWLLEIEQSGTAPDPATAKLLRQFQSLSHPAAMGMVFKVMEFGKTLT
jgi:SAM-dependent MidA family methyltransferase